MKVNVTLMAVELRHRCRSIIVLLTYWLVCVLSTITYGKDLNCGTATACEPTGKAKRAVVSSVKWHCEPGAYCAGEPMIKYLVPFGEKPMPNNIRVLAVFADRQGTVLDFDTGKPSKFSKKALEAPSIQRSPVQINGPILDQHGRAFTSYFCDLYCFNALPSFGEIDGDKVKIEAFPLPIVAWGNPVDFSTWLLSPDARREGYTGLRAVTPDGNVKWTKVYLIQTDGAYVDQRNNEGAADVVESIRHPEYILPGDQYFYLSKGSKSNGRFGSLTMRVRFSTGIPVTHDARIKAVDSAEFQVLLNQAANEIERHYPDQVNLVRQPEDVSSAFSWDGNSTIDVPALINTRIQQRWFKEMMK
jgi:hypothetical protein